MELRKPIFINGTGRSGTTIFNQMFSEHPNLAWLTRLTSDFPSKLFLNRYFMRAIDYPLVGGILKKLSYRGEFYGFLDYYCNGFSAPCRDLFAEDVTNPTKEKFRKALTEMLTPKRNRLVVKITGWPRMGYLREIFEDAKFIHILRDGRSVVNSALSQEWWWGWRGPENWRWGQLSPSHRQEWEEHNKSFVALAAIQWKILMDAFEEAEKTLSSDNYLVIKYEDFCCEPVEIMKKAMEFCELEWTKTFEDSIKKFTLRSANYKWKEDFNQKQQEILEAVLSDYLKKYGYC